MMFSLSIKKSLIMFRQMIKQISRDMMMALLCITPILAGLALHYGIPLIEQLLCSYFGRDSIIEPYYFVFDWLLALLPGMMFAFTGGLVILGEIDDKIAGYMAVTPAGNSGYLFSRLGYPAIIAVVFDYILLNIFSLSNLSTKALLILCISSSLMGIITALVVIVASTNKVEGMAIGKLSGLISVGMFVPLLFSTPIQYVTAFLPSFWIGKFLLEGNLWYLILFLILFIIWLYILIRKYKKKR